MLQVDPDGAGFSAAWLGAKKILAHVCSAPRALSFKPPVFQECLAGSVHLPWHCPILADLLYGEEVQKVVLLVLLVCGIILLPVTPSCPSGFPQLCPCCTLSLLCLFFMLELH